MKFDKNKKTLILDLDETLVFSFYSDDYPNNDYDFEIQDDRDLIRVKYRPHLKDFIDYVQKNFNVVVWTSASGDYAQAVVDQIFTDKVDLISRNDYDKYHIIRSFHYDDGHMYNAPRTLVNMVNAVNYWRKFDDSLIDVKLYVKPIRKVVKKYGIDYKDVIAIDNDPYKFYDSYGNYWWIPDYNGDNSDDDCLLIVKDQLDQLKDLDDVRIKKDNYKKKIKKSI